MAGQLDAGDLGLVQETDELITGLEASPSPETVEALARLLVDADRVWAQEQGLAEALAGRILPQRKALVLASFARVLAHAPKALDDQPWRPRFIRFLTYGFGTSFAINHRAQGFEQEDVLTRGVIDAEDVFYTLIGQDYSLATLTHLRRGLMKALNSATGKAIVRPFLPEALLGVRFTELFDCVDAYAAATGPFKVDEHAAIKDQTRRFSEDAQRFATRYSKDILLPVAGAISTAIDADFDQSRYSKSAELHVTELPKKYPLSAIGQEFTFVVDIDNVGIGPAQGAELILETSDNICLSRSFTYVGDVDKRVRIEVSGEVTEPAPIALISGRLCWSNADRSSGQTTIDIELRSQRSDIPWDDLTAREPYSLQPVSGTDQLVGRSEMLDRLYAEARQEDVGSFFLYGQKRVGKTSVARTLATRIKTAFPERYLVVYLEGGDYVDPDAATTVANLGRRLCTEIRQRDTRLESIPVPPFRDALAPLADFLNDVLRIEPELRILFILDEFDELPLDLYKRGPIGDSFFLTLRSISGRLNFGFGLVGGEKMELILSGQGDALNKFQAIRVDYFDRQHHWADFAELVRRPTAAWLEFTEGAVQRLYDATAGNPYFTILLCRALYRGVVRRHDGYITELEVDVVVRDQVRSLSGNSFQHFWEDGVLNIPERVEQVSIDRRKVLLALAHALRAGSANPPR